LNISTPAFKNSGKNYFSLSTNGTMTTPQSAFPIPASLQDLEREPYNLLPYPQDFDDDDEAARADSFSGLVDLVERGNRTLMSGGVALFQEYDDEQELWNNEDRIQALYTLVRYVSQKFYIIFVVNK
jgi:hypothetical protein